MHAHHGHHGVPGALAHLISQRLCLLKGAKDGAAELCTNTHTSTQQELVGLALVQKEHEVGTEAMLSATISSNDVAERAFVFISPESRTLPDITTRTSGYAPHMQACIIS